MVRPLPTDPDAAEVRALLAEIDRATARVAAALGTLDRDSFHGPSLLGGWTRATIAAHLTWVAERYVAMTGDVLAGVPSTTYPGGAGQRAASLSGFDRVAPDEGARRLLAASEDLARCWRRLDGGSWATTFRETRIGPMRLSRLVALRLTELEVHHVDLGLGYRVADWPAAFVDTCLPLRLSWLGSHHRPSGAPTVRGRWLFAPTDRAGRWLVTAGPLETVVEQASAGAAADAVLSGPSAGLLAFVLGRPPEVSLEIGGDRRLAAAFKEVFPGP